MNKNRIIYDLNTPCRDRRPTTKEDIINDIHVKDYDSAKDLLDDLIDLLDENKENVYEWLVDDDILYNCATNPSWDDSLDYDSSYEDIVNTFFEKGGKGSADSVIYAFLNDYPDIPVLPIDWGYGGVNILYLCVDGVAYKDIEPYDPLTGLDLNTTTEKEVVETLLKYIDDHKDGDEDEDDDKDDENFDLNSFANTMGDWVRDTIKHGGFKGFKTKNDIVARLINLMASDLVEDGYDLTPYLADLID